MPITSESTLEDVMAIYNNNCSYYENDSIPQAKAVVSALDWMLVNIPSAKSTTNAQGAQSINFDVVSMRQAKDAAKEFIASKNLDSSGVPQGTVRTSFRGFRS